MCAFWRMGEDPSHPEFLSEGSVTQKGIPAFGKSVVNPRALEALSCLLSPDREEACCHGLGGGLHVGQPSAGPLGWVEERLF